LRARLDQALAGLPFKAEIFEPFLADVEQARTQAVVTPAALEKTAFASLLRPLLFRSSEQWIATVLLHGVVDPRYLKLVSGPHGGTRTIYLDLKRKSNEIMVRATDRIMRLLGWGALFVYLVLAFSFRDVRKPLYILMPVVSSVVVVTAMLAAVGLRLTVFHMVSLLMVVGLGLDYALFFNRLTHSEEEWATTFKALWVCCATTVLVFGMLMLSHSPPLQAVGLTVSLGAALCLIFGAVWSTAVPPKRRRRRWRRKVTTPASG
jgi:predicted exporter